MQTETEIEAVAGEVAEIAADVVTEANERAAAAEEFADVIVEAMVDDERTRRENDHFEMVMDRISKLELEVTECRSELQNCQSDLMRLSATATAVEATVETMLAMSSTPEVSTAESEEEAAQESQTPEVVELIADESQKDAPPPVPVRAKRRLLL